MKILKKLTAVIISLVTVFAMFPIANITASAYSYTGLEEIGGKVLIESSKKPIVLVNNGSVGRLDAYKFKFNGEIGYCIDPPAVKLLNLQTSMEIQVRKLSSLIQIRAMLPKKHSLLVKSCCMQNISLTVKKL